MFLPISTSTLGSPDSSGQLSAPVSAPSDLAKLTHLTAACSPRDTQKFPTSETPRYSPIQTDRHRTNYLMLLRAGYLANLQACLGKGVVAATNVGYGPQPSELCAVFDPSSGYLKTPQLSLLSSEEGRLTESSVAWPTSGMMCCGKSYPLPPLVLDMDESVSGFLLPTPTARDWKDTPGMAKEPDDRTRNDQLPRRIYVLENSLPRSGIINPEFSLWLMGFPAGWLKLSCTLSEMRSFLKPRKSSSRPSPAVSEES